MLSLLKRIWNVITWTAVILALTLAVLLAGVRFIGITPFSVLSGSMAPTYNTGDLLYVKPVDSQMLWTGDVITFRLAGDVVATHRIVEVVPDKENPRILRYRTKGDANNTADGSLVSAESIIGTPVFSIPCLGYVSHYIQNPPGKYLAIAAAMLLIVTMLLPDILPRGAVSGTRTEKKSNLPKGDRNKNEE